MEEKRNEATENKDYKAYHRQFHTAYKNTHWDLATKAKSDPNVRKEMKEKAKAFRAERGVPLYPMMADIFDFAEEDRAEPNSRTPFSADIRVEKNVVYKTINGEDLVMDIYFPDRPIAGKAPLVMDIPGGGWMIHNRPRRDGYARMFAAIGAVVAVIDHRLCPEVFFPDNLHDCIDAYNYLVDNADKYNIDVNDITVTGDSSGGHLTACIGCAASSKEFVEKLELPALKTKPANLIFISGAFSFDVMYKLPCTHTLIVRYCSGQKSRKAYRAWKYYKESNPYNYINSDFPESYNNGGMTDVLCFGEAKRFSKVLTEAGVKNEYRVGKNPFQSAHCYVLRTPFAPARRDMTALMGWYADRLVERGKDVKENFARVKDFLANYNKIIKG